MIYIKKGQEPDLFLKYRMQPDARFDDMPMEVKTKLREALLLEQGHLCAYCMQRLKNDGDVKIEHFVARTLENELQYNNLLAVCKGGEGSPYSIQHCDTRKGNRPLTISPLRNADMMRIYYKQNGEVHSLDTKEREIKYEENGREHKLHTSPDKDLEDCLNLNCKYGIPLKRRKEALQTFQKELEPYTNNKAKKAFLERMKAKYLDNTAERQPYAGILLWYIEKKLKQCR